MALTKRELLKELGITDRLLKFWVGWYKLPLNRRGRGSTYPPHTVETLRLIKRLADSRYFTMRFVRDLLRASEGGDKSAVDAHLTLCRSMLTRPASASAPEDDFPKARVSRTAEPVSSGTRMGEDLL